MWKGKPLSQGFVDLVADELNVKRVEFVESAEGFVQYKVKPQLKTLGPRYGKTVRRRSGKCCSPPTAQRSCAPMQKNGYFTLTVAGTEVRLGPEDILTEVSQRSDFFTASDRGVSVALDARLTPELLEEGFVREIISKVQMLRREAGFEVTDHIELRIRALDKNDLAMVQGHEHDIQDDVLANLVVTEVVNSWKWDSELMFTDDEVGYTEYSKLQDINGVMLELSVRKV